MDVFVKALECGYKEASGLGNFTLGILGCKNEKTQEAALKKLSFALEMGITEAKPFIEKIEKNLHLKYTKDFKQELILANHYEISRDGEHHRSLVRLNNIYIELDYSLSEITTKENIIWSSQTKGQYLTQIRSPGHVWFIENYNNFIRVLSLWGNQHGFLEYLENKNIKNEKRPMITLKNHYYGKWFKSDSKKASQLRRDCNQILESCENKSTKILDDLYMKMWGVEKQHSNESLLSSIEITAMYKIEKN